MMKRPIQSLLKKNVEKRAIGIQEPIRKTMYDILEENLKEANRKTFLHRIIYIGHHNFPGEEPAVSFFSKSISKPNNTGIIEKLTGFFLYYPIIFAHLVEGDENGIYKHLHYIQKNEQTYLLGDMCLLVDLCHINGRITTDWNSYSGIPHKLLHPIDTNISLTDTHRFIFSCIIKFYQLIDMINSSDKDSETSKHLSTDLHLSTSRFSSKGSNKSSSGFLATMSGSIFLSQTGPFRDILPECELLDFLIKTPYTEDIWNYYKSFFEVKQISIYKDQVWPVPADMIPYDVFDSIYIRSVEMPKKIKEEEVKKKEKRKEGDEEGLEEEEVEEEEEGEDNEIMDK